MLSMAEVAAKAQEAAHCMGGEGVCVCVFGGAGRGGAASSRRPRSVHSFGPPPPQTHPCAALRSQHPPSTHTHSAPLAFDRGGESRRLPVDVGGLRLRVSVCVWGGGGRRFGRGASSGCGTVGDVRTRHAAHACTLAHTHPGQEASKQAGAPAAAVFVAGGGPARRWSPRAAPARPSTRRQTCRCPDQRMNSAPART